SFKESPGPKGMSACLGLFSTPYRSRQRFNKELRLGSQYPVCTRCWNHLSCSSATRIAGSYLKAQRGAQQPAICAGAAQESTRHFVLTSFSISISICYSGA